jgi:uncharacterized protein YjbI with pentapeptide repeats
LFAERFLGKAKGSNFCNKTVKDTSGVVYGYMGVDIDSVSLYVPFLLKPRFQLTDMKLFYAYVLLAAPLVVNLFFASSAFANTLAETKKLENFKKLESTGKCIGCDLSGASFVGIDFTGVAVNLQKANLNGANFAGAIMPKANLTGVSAVGANFLGADLQGATLKNANLIYSNFAKAKLNNALLEITDLQGANLAEADLSGAKITRSDFVGANIYKIRLPANAKDPIFANYFKDDQKGIRVVLPSGATTTERTVSDITLESSIVVRRRFRIPAWIGSPSSSSAGTARYHNPQDPNLILELW